MSDRGDTLSAMWEQTAAEQDGIISRLQLRACGLSDSGIGRLVASGALRPVTRGVFLVRGAPLTYRARLWAAALSTDGVLGFATGAQLWGYDEACPLRVDVIVSHARRVTIPRGVRVHRVHLPGSAVTRHDRLPVTTRAWTLLDHLGRLPRAEAYRLADRAFQRGWLTATDIERRLRDYPGRQGNRTLRLIAARCGDGAAAESERVLHRLLRQAGVAGWVANYPLWVNGELIAVLDVGVPAQRLAIEVDGWAYHSDVDRFQRDRQRQNTLIGFGWTVLRFTWADLTQRPGYVVATIRRQAA